MHIESAAASCFVKVNGLNIHYLDNDSNKPVLVLMHGLTANSRTFDGIVEKLRHSFRVIRPDFRGNGLSDKPLTGYSMDTHAKDIVDLIKHLEEPRVYLAGHSFGGYVAMYIAANYPEYVSKLVILDAAKSMNPNAALMLSKAISRLDTVYPDFESYIEQVKEAPYLSPWDPAMVGYYRADVMDLPGGKVKSRGNISTITQKSMGLGAVKWTETIKRIQQPTVLVNATGIYTMGEALLPANIAKETVGMMKHAGYIGVDGNHQTMLYGNGALQIAHILKEFLPV